MVATVEQKERFAKTARSVLRYLHAEVEQIEALIRPSQFSERKARQMKEVCAPEPLRARLNNGRRMPKATG